MNQVIIYLLSIWVVNSQTIHNNPPALPFQISPFITYLLPQTYSPQFHSFPQKQLRYITPANTQLLSYPVRKLALNPNLYLDSRALCSLCSCSSDYGCAYNCHKCPALCYSCSCSSSLGCRYNCDKCQKNDGNSVEETTSIEVLNIGKPSVQEVLTIPQECTGLQAESELCTWGPICQTIKDGYFPNCGYDCNTCKFSSNGIDTESNKQENDKQENGKQEIDKQEIDKEENDKQENDKQEIDKQENDKQENDKQENDKQENITPENNEEEKDDKENDEQEENKQENEDECLVLENDLSKPIILVAICLWIV